MTFFRNLSQVIRQAFTELWRHKLRSFLTMFGIGWGICALALIIASGEGFRQGQRKNWKQLGDSIVMVFGGRTELQAGGQRAGKQIRLMESDVQTIREQCYLVETVAGEVKNWEVSVESNFNAGKFLIVGVDPEYLKIRTLPVAVGRTVGWNDVENSSRVCVLGDEVRKQLFEGQKNVLDQEIRINGYTYSVVGLMGNKDQNSSYDGWDNDKILIPSSSLRKDCPPSRETAVEGFIQMIVYQPVSVEKWKEAQFQVRSVLGRIHQFDPNDEAATPMWDTIETAAMFDDIFQSLGFFLGSVALITLSLGGVGVMNTMMTSVAERTPEIGLKKALGATRLRILMEFLFEGIVLALISGTAGISLVAGIAALVNSFPMPAMFSGLPLNLDLVLMLAGSLGAVALFSSLPPAWRAAGLTPVQALSYEK